MNRSQLLGDLPEPVNRYFDEVALMQPPTDLLDAAIGEIERSHQVNRFAPLPVVGLAAAAVIGTAVLLFNLLPSPPMNVGGDETPIPSTGPTPTPGSVDIASHPPVGELPSAGTIAARYEVADAGYPVLYAHGSVWLSNQETGRLTRMNPSTGELTGTLDVNPDPEATRYDLSAVADDRWVYATGLDNTVVKIDPETNEVVDRIAIGTLIYRMVVHDGDLWITDLDQGYHVIRLDPDTGEIVWDMRYPQWPAGVAATDEAVWVAPYRSGQLLQLDPDTGQLVQSFPASIYGMQALVHGDSVFITGNQERPVERFDITEGRVVNRIAELATVAFDGDRLYGLRWDGVFFELDPMTLEPISALEIPGGETASAVLGDGVFFVASGADVVVIDHTP